MPTHYGSCMFMMKRLKCSCFSLFLPLVSLVLLPWHIALVVLGVMGLFFSIVTLLTGMLSICGCELLHCIMNYIIEYLLEIAFGKYYMSITVLVCSYYTLGNFLTIKVFCQCSELCLLPLPPPPLSQVHRCCWTVVITFLFTSVIGIPFAVLIIHNFKNKGLT